MVCLRLYCLAIQQLEDSANMLTFEALSFLAIGSRIEDIFVYRRVGEIRRGA
jgi:hypothetical protein